MTITIDIKPEVEAELARQAAARGRRIEAHAASLLEDAASLTLDTGPSVPRRRPPGKKSLVELFADSPLRGLDLDLSRNKSNGRPVDL